MLMNVGKCMVVMRPLTCGEMAGGVASSWGACCCTSNMYEGMPMPPIDLTRQEVGNFIPTSGNHVSYPKMLSGMLSSV